MLWNVNQFRGLSFYQINRQEIDCLVPSQFSEPSRILNINLNRVLISVTLILSSKVYFRISIKKLRISKNNIIINRINRIIRNIKILAFTY